MAADTSQLIIVLLVFSLMWLVFRWQRQSHAGPTQVTTTVQRLLRPRTPHDCPARVPFGCSRQPCQPGTPQRARRFAPGTS